MNSAKPPPPPHRSGTSRPPPPPPLRTSKPPVVPSAGHATAPAPAAQDSAQAHAAYHAHAVQEPAYAPAPSAAPPIVAQPGPETRLRVSVKLSVRDPNLLLARPLREGEAPPPGTRAAVLVLCDPAVEPEPRNGGAST
jgi:hypothetical protein